MNESNRKKIHAYLDAHKQEMFDDLAAQIRIPSAKTDPTPNAPFGQGCVDALKDFLIRAERLGFATKNVDNYMGCVDMGDPENCFGILVHLDVVPEGQGWLHDPYGAEIVGDVMYGRGTLDDKGPAISAMYAMAAIRDACIPLTRGVRLLLGTDEESGSQDMEYFLTKEKLPPIAISPDAEYPVVNIEKGMLRLALSASYDAPNGPRLLSMQGGTRANVVPAEVTALVAGVDLAYVRGAASAVTAQTEVAFSCEQKGDSIEITAFGFGAHASRPDTGKNAINALLTLIAALPLAEGDAANKLRALAKAFPIDGYYGQHAGIRLWDDVSGELTVNLGLIEADENSFAATLDIRYPITANFEMLTMLLADTTGLQVDVKSHMTPHYVSEKSDLVQALLRAYEAETGLTGECLAIGGGTYARQIPGSVSFGCLLPGDPDSMHQPEECVKLEKVLLNAKVLAAAIVEFCGA